MTMDGEAEVKPGERARAVVAVESLLRIARKAMDCYPQDDLETILVLLTVGAASSGSHLRDPAMLAHMDTEPVPDAQHKPISGRAVAQSTGLPRETVRRRIDALVAAGRLTREPRGVRTSEGVLMKNRNLEFVRFVIQEMNSSAVRMGRYGPT
ncbi:hypothetical protein [Brevundimonas sp. Root1279]|uniref:hypothetical protein n=1 Tax=Brevundimonas sp. Root1279 TaxID=1736443 RepID=UPI0006F98D19|nr:hypothetical protein [Brevundimonas sp. Root1279]KQW82229.1 hypothetical protein ASC65_08085 [Brevundimonas sp. Root1279]